jgi:hypothetical protein
MAAMDTQYDTPSFRAWAPTPPMGWNSWDCFATTVTEDQVMAQASFMAEKLKGTGWRYVVVDAQWFEPGADDFQYRKDARLCMDGYGRLLPAPNRFPSSAGGAGFKPLADRVHALGLGFGLHLMRGIPRQAVRENLPLLGSTCRAQDIADQSSVCSWNGDNFGVDTSRPGSQEYYDSVFALLAEWGVDFVKVDDISRPYLDNSGEIEAVRRAIDRTGWPMVLSLSPGATDLRAAGHAAAHANLWRISDDFWDRWLALREQFGRLALWNGHRAQGAWPDADMLPLGTISLGGRTTRFTRDEQTAMMTLWCVARSPLMHGGDLSKTDDFTLSLLTNEEVISVNQRSAGNRPVAERDGMVAWTAEVPGSPDRYLALFNLRDRVELSESNARHATVLSTAPGVGEQIDIGIGDGQRLFLAAFPADERGGFVPVAWESPRFAFAGGVERPLADFKWTKADAQWDSAAISAPEGGKPAALRTLASALIEYAIPPGAERFKARVSAQRPSGAREDSAVRILSVVGTEANQDRRDAVPMEIPLADIGMVGPVRVRDLWARAELGTTEGSLRAAVPFHGARLFRLIPAAG